MEKKIDAALPVGSTRQEVEAWLTAERADFSFTDKLSSMTHNTRLVEKVPDLDSYSGVVSAILRDTDRDLLVTGNIQMYFLFGSDGLLRKRLVMWIGTGL